MMTNSSNRDNMSPNRENKERFYYWSGRVQLRNTALLENANHVETHKLRHECTNYDQLWKSREVQNLSQLEQDREVAIIKYECTSKALQRRASLLREKAAQMQLAYQNVHQEYSRLQKALRALQEMLFGKDQEIEKLTAKVTALQTENEAMKADFEEHQAHATVLENLARLQKDYEKLNKRKKELATNNKSLGGRLSHTKRYKKQRDEARTILAEQEKEIAQIREYNKSLKIENRQLTDRITTLRAN